MSTALATVVDVVKLGEALLVPPRKIGDIQLQRSTVAQKRKALIDYFIKYSEFASWTELANSLYQRGHYEAMTTAKAFIKQTPGRYTIWSISCKRTIIVSHVQNVNLSKWPLKKFT